MVVSVDTYQVREGVGTTDWAGHDADALDVPVSVLRSRGFGESLSRSPVVKRAIEPVAKVDADVDLGRVCRPVDFRIPIVWSHERIIRRSGKVA